MSPWSVCNTSTIRNQNKFQNRAYQCNILYADDVMKCHVPVGPCVKMCVLCACQIRWGRSHLELDGAVSETLDYRAEAAGLSHLPCTGDGFEHLLQAEHTKISHR